MVISPDIKKRYRDWVAERAKQLGQRDPTTALATFDALWNQYSNILQPYDIAMEVFRPMETAEIAKMPTCLEYSKMISEIHNYFNNQSIAHIRVIDEMVKDALMSTDVTKVLKAYGYAMMALGFFSASWKIYSAQGKPKEIGGAYRRMVQAMYWLSQVAYKLGIEDVVYSPRDNNPLPAHEDAKEVYDEYVDPLRDRFFASPLWEEKYISDEERYQLGLKPRVKLPLPKGYKPATVTRLVITPSVVCPTAAPMTSPPTKPEVKLQIPTFVSPYPEEGQMPPIEVKTVEQKKIVLSQEEVKRAIKDVVNVYEVKNAYQLFYSVREKHRLLRPDIPFPHEQVYRLLERYIAQAKEAISSMKEPTLKGVDDITTKLIMYVLNDIIAPLEAYNKSLG